MTGTTTHCLGGGASVIAASAADLLTQSSNWGPIALSVGSVAAGTRGPSRAGNQEVVAETDALARLARLHEDENVEESVDAIDALDAMSKRRKRTTQ